MMVEAESYYISILQPGHGKLLRLCIKQLGFKPSFWPPEPHLSSKSAQKVQRYERKTDIELKTIRLAAVAGSESKSREFSASNVSGHSLTTLALCQCKICYLDFCFFDASSRVQLS